jgi:hypothetical protein
MRSGRVPCPAGGKWEDGRYDVPHLFRLLSNVEGELEVEAWDVRCDAVEHVLVYKVSDLTRQPSLYIGCDREGENAAIDGKLFVKLSEWCQDWQRL